VLQALGAEGVTLMVSELGFVTIGHNLSLAFHVVTQERVHDDVIMPLLCANVDFM